METEILELKLAIKTNEQLYLYEFTNKQNFGKLKKIRTIIKLLKEQLFILESIKSEGIPFHLIRNS